MVDLTKLERKETNDFLFIPMNATQEFLWLLKNSCLNYSGFKIYNWRVVKNGQIPMAIKNMTQNEKLEELEKFYDPMTAKEMMTASTLIVSRYDKHDLFNAFKETLMGDGDPDYKKYNEEQQAYANETLQDSEGITIAARNV